MRWFPEAHSAGTDVYILGFGCADVEARQPRALAIGGWTMDVTDAHGLLPFSLLFMATDAAATSRVALESSIQYAFVPRVRVKAAF